MRVHFIAIGGSVMHQLAIALKHKGFDVTGSDDEIFEPASTNLEIEGILPPQKGWFPEKICADIREVILGMHAKEDNPELIKATQLGLKVFSFPEYIYRVSEKKKRVAIGGSHGKTTTTAMIMHVLKHLRRDFDYLVGARLEGFDQSVKITNAPLIICEADEYPASVIEKRPKFHFLDPHVAVITGIAWDHINVFPTFAFYLKQFTIFIEKIEKGGLLIYNATDKIFKDLGISNHDFALSIAGFAGAAKRLELLAEKKDCNIYRDFAHAPSKVNASVDGVKLQFPDRKLVAVLELHTFSSLTAQFMLEYSGAMENADTAIVFFSKHALELKRMPPLEIQVVKEGFNKPGLEVITVRQQLEEKLKSLKIQNTNFLSMSSGNYEGMDISKVMDVSE